MIGKIVFPNVRSGRLFEPNLRLFFKAVAGGKIAEFIHHGSGPKLWNVVPRWQFRQLRGLPYL